MLNVQRALSASILALAACNAQAILIAGGDYAGADLIVGNGDVLSGTFTNVGSFSIGAGVTAYVDAGVALSVSAASANIAGVLDGSGRGSPGGAAPVGASANGIAGSGTGGGAGGLFGNCVHASGGAGGGYGAAGGNSGAYFDTDPPPPAMGGSAYGDTSSHSVAMGSGGGSAGNHCAVSPGVGGAGGAGGASIAIMTVNELMVLGQILANGDAGAQGNFVDESTSAGGGGSGGGILLDGSLTINGLLSAAGGNGGDWRVGFFGSDRWGQGGGGGAGGRIKLFGVEVDIAGLTSNVLGGSAGSSSDTSQGFEAVAGSSGSVFASFQPADMGPGDMDPDPTGSVPTPGTIALFGLGLAALSLARKKKI